MLFSRVDLQPGIEVLEPPRHHKQTCNELSRRIGRNAVVSTHWWKMYRKHMGFRQRVGTKPQSRLVRCMAASFLIVRSTSR